MLYIGVRSRRWRLLERILKCFQQHLPFRIRRSRGFADHRLHSLLPGELPLRMGGTEIAISATQVAGRDVRRLRLEEPLSNASPERPPLARPGPPRPPAGHPPL